MFVSRLFCFLFLTITISLASSERILVLSFFGSKSHKNVFDPLYIELARKGHSITVVHPEKSGYTEKNMKEISGPGMHDGGPPGVEKINVFDLRLKGMKIRTPINPFVIPFLEHACSAYYELDQVKALLNQKFALVFVSSHMNECAYGFLHKLNTSFIFVHPHPMENYKLSSFTGLRPPPSFVPSYVIGDSTDEMSFMERVSNFIAYQSNGLLYEWYYLPAIRAVYQKYLGPGIPSIREIERNASLVMQNAHFSLTRIRPGVPQMIDVGGLHCSPGRPLPKDLEDFVSNDEGFIFFSLGSHVEPSRMPADIKAAFVQAFSKLKQRVLWKWDEDSIEGLSANVRLVKWAPQQDLLAHPKIKAFISHGGLLSIEESMYHGVPMIGLPLFGDQHDWNMKQVESYGYGVMLELNGLTTDKVLEATNKVLSDKSYTVAAQRVGKIFKDRAQDSLKTAVYWSEYVIRHGGAIHLRSPARDLNFIQYYCLDVMAFLGVTTSLGVLLLVGLVRMVCCKGGSSANNKRSNNSKKKHN